MRRRLWASSCVVVVAVVLLGAAEGAAGARPALRVRAQTAGVQLALRALGRYRGPVDGIAGPLTMRAVGSLQRAGGLPVTGVADAATLRLLGPLGRPTPGTRVMGAGMIGLDVAVLQFELHAHHYPLPATGRFGAATQRALLRFQRSAGLRPDGLAGAATWTALERRGRPAQTAQPTLRLRPPLAIKARAVPTRGGVELFCPYASAVAAAAAGSVTYAGDRGRGYGYTVITRDSHGIQLLYAHLARIDVHRGRRLVAGAMIGLAGWTGKTSASTSLLLQLSADGHQLDPLPALQPGTNTP